MYTVIGFYILIKIYRWLKLYGQSQHKLIKANQEKLFMASLQEENKKKIK